MGRRHRSREQATTSPIRQRERSKSITATHAEKSTKPSTKLNQVMSWSSRLVTCSRRWLTRELCCHLDGCENSKNAPIEDPMKFIPSVVSFLVCVLLAHQFSESLDTAINKCLALTSSIINAVASFTEALTWYDIEAAMSGVLIVLLWIGAFRIVSSTFSKIVVLSKLRACNYAD